MNSNRVSYKYKETSSTSGLDLESPRSQFKNCGLLDVSATFFRVAVGCFVCGGFTHKIIQRNIDKWRGYYRASQFAIVDFKRVALYYRIRSSCHSKNGASILKGVATGNPIGKSGLYISGKLPA